jgi:hypothetical protein
MPKVVGANAVACSAGGTPAAGRCPAGEDVAQVGLTMDSAAPLEVKGIEVAYRGPIGPTLIVFPTSSSVKGLLAAAKKDDADIAFAGTWAKTPDDKGAYNIDAFGGYMHAVGRTPKAGRVGFYGQAKTKDSPSMDPQSFLAYGVYQRVIGSGGFHGPFQTPFANLRGGWEFAKSGEQRNFVVSPVLTLPFRLAGGTLGLIAPGVTVPHGTVDAGIEFVKPLETKLPTDEWRYRVLLGGSLVAGRQPERPGYYALTFKGGYQVRLLSDDEPFKDARNAPVDPATGVKGKPVLEFGDQPRHHTEAKLEYFPIEWLGFQVKYEYGSLPPAFVITGHTYTLGLTFTLKQTSYGRFSILKP